jgi:tetratricopeptide (TPR) repeat protein
MTIRIDIFGPMRVADAAGQDLTPKGSRKVLGLLALLATAPGFTRGRAELQTLLWSDRDPRQQSASLRQALAELRKGLGPHGAILVADRAAVGLDRDLVRVDDDPGDNNAPLLDGLTIPDPAFESWLRLERGLRGQRPGFLAATGGATRAARRPVLYFLRTEQPSDAAAMLANLLVDRLSQSLLEQFSVEVTELPPRLLGRQGPQDLIFSTEALINAGLAAIRITLDAGPRRRRLWSAHHAADPRQAADALDNDQLHRMVNEAVESYAEALLGDSSGPPNRLNASVLGRTAVRQIFTMRPDLYPGADDLLDRAFCLDPRGVYLAWRVLLRIVQLVERHPVDAAATSAEAIDLYRRALEFEPYNSLVQAAASNVLSLVENNAPAALEMAQRAVRRNAANPFAWDCLSTAALHAGKLEEAYVFAVRAQRLAGDTPFKHWYDMGRALTATVTGRLDEALGLAGAASVTPHFKPPLRYIAALYAHNGQPERAELAIARLQALEPGFTADQMVRDPTYPVAALRKSQILHKGLFGVLH